MPGGNSKDTVPAIIHPLALTLTPHTEEKGELNSILLSSTYEPRRNHTIGSHPRDRIYNANKRRYYGTKTYRKDTISGDWEINRNDLETKVRIHQMKLVELASITGDTRNNRVLKYQRQLALMKEFRMLAVHKVVTNKGHKTPGIDKMIIEKDEQK